MFMCVCFIFFLLWLVKVEGVDDFILLFGYCQFGISAVACVRLLLEFHPNKTNVVACGCLVGKCQVTLPTLFSSFQLTTVMPSTTKVGCGKHTGIALYPVCSWQAFFVCIPVILDSVWNAIVLNSIVNVSKELISLLFCVSIIHCLFEPVTKSWFCFHWNI